MIKMYALNDKGNLEIIEIAVLEAIAILDNCPYVKRTYNNVKFLTLGEYEELKKSNKTSRKLYYELKED